MITVELKAQINTYESWLRNYKGAEPFNPWPQFIEQLVKETHEAQEDCNFAASPQTLEEVIINWIQREVPHNESELHLALATNAWCANKVHNVLEQYKEVLDYV